MNAPQKGKSLKESHVLRLKFCQDGDIFHIGSMDVFAHHSFQQSLASGRWKQYDVVTLKLRKVFYD